jgi:hypothetical protein
LIPAQLATARSFVEGIRASDLRDSLLFDPRLVAYVNVLKQEKADWDAHERRKVEPAAADTTVAPKDAAPPSADQKADSVKPNSGNSEPALFDPGNTYHPPNTAVVTSSASRKLSDAAACLIWVDHDCEIATLDEKYLRLNGAMDPVTHDWKIKDRAKLDSLLQMAEIGARRGISFASNTGIDSSVLAMIYEKAANQRTRGTEAASLDSLRNFWRCALLGNMCWQLAHTRKAEAVDLSKLAPDDGGKPAKKGDKKSKTESKTETAQTGTDSASTNATASTPPATNAPDATTNTVVAVTPQGDATVKQNVTVTTPSTAPPADVPTPVPDTPQPVPAPPTPAPASEPVSVPAPSEAKADQPPATQAVTPPPPPATPRGPVVLPSPSPAPTAVANDVPANVPVAPIARPDDSAPATNSDVPAVPLAPAPAPDVHSLPPAPSPGTASLPPAPAPHVGDAEMDIPVAPIARAQDLAGTSDAPATTNSAPAPPIRPTRDNADGHSDSFP